MKKFLAIISLTFSAGILCSAIVLNIYLKQNCTGYLKRAADANTVDIAITQLSVAISYLEKHNLTSGYTSILWKTPDEDVSFFYNNLRASRRELFSVQNSPSALEKTNVLIKLRETLLDTGSSFGDQLTIPKGLSRHPHNTIWALLLIITVVSFIFGFVILFKRELKIEIPVDIVLYIIIAAYFIIVDFM